MSNWRDIFNKLNDRQFEVKDEYWNDLEKMLDGHSRKKKIIHNKWWLGGIAFLIISSVSVYFLSGSDGVKEQSNAKPEVANNKIIEKNITKETPASDKYNRSSSENKNENDVKESSSLASEEITGKKAVKKPTLHSQKNTEVTITKEKAFIQNPLAGTGITKKEIQPKQVNSIANNSKAKEAFALSLNNKRNETGSTINVKNEDFDKEKNVDDKSKLPFSINNTEAINTSLTQTQIPQPNTKGSIVSETVSRENESKIAINNSTETDKEIGKEISETKKEERVIASSILPSEQTKQETQNNNFAFSNNREVKTENISANNFSELFMVDIIKPYNYVNLDSLGTIQSMPPEEVRKFPLRPDFRVGIYAGKMFSNKILKSDTALKNYIDRRKAEEKSITTINAGADFSIGLNRWSLTTGINYHKQGEVTEYKPEFFQWVKQDSISWSVQDNSHWNVQNSSFTILVDSSYWTTRDTTITYWNDISQTYDTTTIALNHYYINKLDTFSFYLTDSTYISQIDSISTTTTDSVQQKITEGISTSKQTTSTSYVEIPLLIGYEFHIKRLTLMVRTGLGMGILSTQNLTYLKQDISGVEKIEESRMNKMMWNYLLRISAVHYLSERIAINLEPAFRMNINSVFKEKAFSQKYWNVGANVGLMYKF